MINAFRILIFCFVTFLMVFSTASCFSGENMSETDKLLDTVTLHLKWKHQFQFAGYYAALEKGLYRLSHFYPERMLCAGLF